MVWLKWSKPVGEESIKHYGTEDPKTTRQTLFILTPLASL